MNITSEQAVECLKEMAAVNRIAALGDRDSGEAKIWREEADILDWAIARIAELEAQFADMRRDLSAALIGVTDVLEALITPSAPERPLVENARAVLQDAHDGTKKQTMQLEKSYGH